MTGLLASPTSSRSVSVPKYASHEQIHVYVLRYKIRSNSSSPNMYSASLGYTPLFYACSRGHREIVELLLFHGADGVAEVFDSELKNAVVVMYSYIFQFLLLLWHGFVCVNIHCSSTINVRYNNKSLQPFTVLCKCMSAVICLYVEC